MFLKNCVRSMEFLSVKHANNMLLEAFPGKIDGSVKCIDMSHIVELLPASEMNHLFDKVDLSDDDEEMGDFSGYTGIKTRDRKDLEVYTYERLVELMVKDNKLPFILKSIKDIDQDNNGYVTTTELEDIIKVHYPQLTNKNLKKLFKPFASIQNRILIDYKSLRKDLIDKIKAKLEGVKCNKEPKDDPLTFPTRKISKTKLNSLTHGNLARLGKNKTYTL